MCNNNLFQLWLFNRCIDIPDFKRASLSSNKHMIYINLIEVGRTVLCLESLLNSFWPRFDIYINNDDLFLLETWHSKHRRWALYQSICFYFNHGVSIWWLRSSNKYWIYGWLCLFLLFLCIFIFHVWYVLLDIIFWIFFSCACILIFDFITITIIHYLFLFLFHNFNFFHFWLWL